MRRLAHVVGPFGDDATAELTLETIRLARDFSAGRIRVSVVVVRGGGDRDPPAWASAAFELGGASDGRAGEAPGRAPPALAVLLDRAWAALPEAEHLVYTEPAAGVMPYFYQALDRWLEAGWDALALGRRTVEAGHAGRPGIPRLYAEVGAARDGYSGFVWPRRLPRLHLGRIRAGARGWDTALRWALRCHARRLREVRDEHLTFVPSGPRAARHGGGGSPPGHRWDVARVVCRSRLRWLWRRAWDRGSAARSAGQG